MNLKMKIEKYQYYFYYHYIVLKLFKVLFNYRERIYHIVINIIMDISLIIRIFSLQFPQEFKKSILKISNS